MELAVLVSKAGRATPDRRIELRDRIAAYGAPAIEAVRPWLADPVLAAFAIRVIERAGTNGDAAHAMKVLRSARSTLPAVVKGDLDWALKQLRPRAQPTTSTARPAIAHSDWIVRGERPQLSTVARRRAR